MEGWIQTGYESEEKKGKSAGIIQISRDGKTFIVHIPPGSEEEERFRIVESQKPPRKQIEEYLFQLRQHRGDTKSMTVWFFRNSNTPSLARTK